MGFGPGRSFSTHPAFLHSESSGSVVQPLKVLRGKPKVLAVAEMFSEATAVSMAEKTLVSLCVL
jgi:hypothetical protein